MSEPARVREPEADSRGARRTSWKEYAVRFVFGGVITAVTGVLAGAFGPSVAGLFLAFPAILPASLTLIQKHDDRRQAGRDAEGAAIGSIGLVGFGLVVWSLGTRAAAWIVLLAATVAWFAVSAAIWYVHERVSGDPSND